MKKITLFLLLLMTSSVIFGQFTRDFEDGTSVPQFAFDGVGFGNIANPDATGINTTSRVLEVNKPDAAQWFSGMGFQDTGNVLVDLANGTTFKMKVWAPFVQSVRMRLQADLDNVANTAYNSDVMVPSAMEWVEMTFDFSSFGNTTSQYQELVIQVNYDPACEGGGCSTVGTGNGGLWYIDDIVQEGGVITPPDEDASLSDLTVDGTTVMGFSPNTTMYNVEVPNGTTTVPMVAATATQAGANVSITQATAIPGTATIDVTATNGTDTEQYTVNFTEAAGLPSAPPAAPSFDNASDFTSIFSNSTSDVALNGIGTFGDASLEDITIDGNVTKRLTFSNPGSGFQFELSNGIDATVFDMFYMNFWVEGTADPGEIIQAFLQNFDGSNAFQNNVIGNFDPGALGTGTWVTVNAPISGFADFANGAANIRQIQFVGAGGNGFGPIYFDNIVLYKNGTLSTTNEGLFESSVFPNPSNTAWNIRTPNTTIRSVQVFNVLGKSVISNTYSNDEARVSVETLPSGIYLARVTTDLGVKTLKLIRE